ncbi:MAG: SRPBCC domain-containing protein [Pseudolysinimonas sp.]
MSEFQIHRVVPQSVEEVWAAFTVGDHLAAWFWPARFQTTVSIDLQVGGSFRIASEPAGLAVSGNYVEIDEPARLVHTWRWDGEDEETLVTMTFREVDGGTGITILHERFADEETGQQNALGWQSCLDRLASGIVQA